LEPLLRHTPQQLKRSAFPESEYATRFGCRSYVSPNASRAATRLFARSAWWLSLVLAIAEMQLLFLDAGMAMRDEPLRSAALAACGAVLFTAVVGVQRLRAWGLVLQPAAAIAIAALAWKGALAFDPMLTKTCVVVAALQLVLPIAIVTPARRRRRPSPSAAPSSPSSAG
jgi:hypothetical protein